MSINVPYSSEESQEDPSSQPFAEPLPLPTPVPVGAFSVPLNGAPKVKIKFMIQNCQAQVQVQGQAPIPAHPTSHHMIWTLGQPKQPTPLITFNHEEVLW